MLERKDWFITLLGAILGAAVAVVLILCAAPPGAIPKSRIISLFVFGTICLVFVFFYFALEKGWIHKSWTPRNLLKVILLIFVSSVPMGLFCWVAWPVDPYCYFSPVFGMHVNATNGVKDAFLLVADNPTNVGIEGVQVDMIEKPEQNESLERGIGRTQNARSCNLGYLRAKGSGKCSFMIPLDTTGEKSFWLNIETKDFRFHEDLIVWWVGKQWQGDFDLLRIEPEGEKTIRKMKSR